jgi:hypothetical protein
MMLKRGRACLSFEEKYFLVQPLWGEREIKLEDVAEFDSASWFSLVW